MLAGAAGLLILAYAVSPTPVTLADVVQSSVSLTLAWWLGTTLRVRAAYAAAMAERADLLQRIHEEVAAHAVAQERLRIARELHDVVAYSMSVVTVQSGVALHLLDSRPEQARTAIAAIVARAGRRSTSCAGCSASCGRTPPRASSRRARPSPTCRPSSRR